MSTFYLRSLLNGNVIDIEEASTQPGALLDAYPMKVTGNSNQLWELVPDPAGSGYSFLKSQLSGNVIDIMEASKQPKALLDAYPQKTTGTDNQLWEFVPDPAGSGYVFIVSKLNGNVVDILGGSAQPGASLDSFPRNPAGQTANQLWAALTPATFPTVVPAQPKPGAGLGSNSNYIFYNNCNPITGLSISVDVTEAIVSKSDSGSTTGFGFQLNCYSPKNERSAWQQYVLTVWGSEIEGAVDNWPVSGPNIINYFFGMASTPNNTIPAGYQIRISLQNDSNNNISGATFVVTDNTGKTVANVPVTLTSISGVNSSDLAPITGFELNLVGPVNGESAVLSSGAGYITYTASSVLTPLSGEPPCTESGYVTAEKANSFYAELPAQPNTAFTQAFYVSSELPMISKAGKIRPYSRR